MPNTGTRILVQEEEVMRRFVDQSLLEHPINKLEESAAMLPKAESKQNIDEDQDKSGTEVGYLASPG